MKWIEREEDKSILMKQVKLKEEAASKNTNGWVA